MDEFKNNIYIVPTPRMGSIGQNSTFSERGHVAYQIKVNQECSNMVAIYFARRPPFLTLEMGSLGQNSTFQNMVMVQDNKCSNRVTNNLHADPPPPRVWGQKIEIQLFRTWSCCISN